MVLDNYYIVPVLLSSSPSFMFACVDWFQEKRDLIVQEFYSTEQQYVETLQMLVEVCTCSINDHTDIHCLLTFTALPSYTLRKDY